MWGTRNSACMFVITHYCYWLKLRLCKSMFPDVELHVNPNSGSALPLDTNVSFSPFPLHRIKVNGRWIWLDACATVPSEVVGEVFTSTLFFSLEGSQALSYQPVNQSVRETGRQIGRRYSWLQSEPIPLAWLPDSRDRRERWSQEAYQRSIHNGPHYSFKRRSHTSLSPSHHPVLETTLLFSSSVSLVLSSDTSSFSPFPLSISLALSLSLSSVFPRRGTSDVNKAQRQPLIK